MDSYVLVHNLPILLSLGFSFFSSIGCFRFLGVVADSSGNRFHFRGVADFIGVVGHHNSPCGDLFQETTPIHSFFGHPPFECWQTFTASPSLNAEGRMGSDSSFPLTSTMASTGSSHTFPSYCLLSLPTHRTGIRSMAQAQKVRTI